MVLYTPQAGPRMAYMAHWLGMRLVGAPLPVFTEADALPAGVPVLNYSNHLWPAVSSQYQICPHGLLHQDGIVPQQVTVQQENGMPSFFPVAGGDHGFDILSAAFFLLSRYEEYFSDYQKDEYGRYSHTNSVAYCYGFLKRPVVDEWIEDLKARLASRFPGLQFQTLKPSVLATCDVDIAWSYRHKGLLRTLGGHLNDFRHKRWHALLERWLVLAGFKRDPFDIITELEEAHRYHQVPSMYFFLLAAERKGYDRNIPPRNKYLRRLMRWLDEETQVGIHFSWASSEQPALMQEERRYMEQVLGHAVHRNRMHYVNFHLPDTYRQLLDAGITEDYSMGYGTINGFRAGTSHPYLWYDLGRETATTLLVFPFAWMDANSIFEQQDDPDTAYQEWISLYERVRATGGTFVSICHNHLMGLDAEGRKWWLMYHRCLKACGKPLRDE